MNENEYVPKRVSPPGETILEMVQELEMSHKELRKKLNWTERFFDEVIRGDGEITFPHTLRLGRVLGPSVKFWREREHNYRKSLQPIVKFKPHLRDNNRELVKVLSDDTVVIANDITFDEALKVIKDMATSLAEMSHWGISHRWQE